MNTSDVYECISIAKENKYTEPARAAVAQMDEVFVTLDQQSATIAEQAARIAELEKALGWMCNEFQHDDHNLAYRNCNCESHQHYHEARALLKGAS